MKTKQIILALCCLTFAITSFAQQKQPNTTNVNQE